jgi:hypothetical protein
MGSHEPLTDHPRGRRLTPGGSFINIRRDDPDGPEHLAQYEADLRASFGDDLIERIQRDRELSNSPRPLSDAEKAVLRQTLAPVLHDLAATGQTLPGIREEAHHDRGEDTVCAWIQKSGGRGQGIEVWLPYGGPDRVSSLAEQLQSWKNDELIDAGLRPWPPCPDHEDCFALWPQTRDDVAVWCCPRSSRVIAEIGRLGLR